MTSFLPTAFPILIEGNSVFQIAEVWNFRGILISFFLPPLIQSNNKIWLCIQSMSNIQSILIYLVLPPILTHHLLLRTVC